MKLVSINYLSLTLAVHIFPRCNSNSSGSSLCATERPSGTYIPSWYAIACASASESGIYTETFILHLLQYYHICYKNITNGKY